MSIEKLMDEVFFLSLKKAYGEEDRNFKTIVMGFFCIEDWGPWR